MSDFSGVCFGISFDQRSGNIGIHFPGYIDSIDKPLYPGYDEKEFKKLNSIQKLNWMYSNCDFIPFKPSYEFIRENCGYSFKYSHIKRDNNMMKRLKGYLKKCENQPNDDVYYYINFIICEDEDIIHMRYYLTRDLEKSPKTKENEEKRVRRDCLINEVRDAN